MKIESSPKLIRSREALRPAEHRAQRLPIAIRLSPELAAGSPMPGRADHDAESFVLQIRLPGGGGESARRRALEPAGV